MTARYDIWLCDPRGNRIGVLDQSVTFAGTKEANGIGKIAIRLPVTYEGLIGPDYLMDVWRTPEGGAPRQFNVYFIRLIRFHKQEDTDTITVYGYDLNELLNRRIVAYYAGTAYTTKTDNAGDVIKALVRENLGSSATDTDRNLTSYGLSVDVDLADGVSLTKGCAWRNLLTVCQEIAEASAQNSEPLYFGFVPGYSGQTITATFRTWENQPGQDHGDSSNAPIYFGEAWGNLSDPVLEYDYTEEATVVYAGGPGEEEARDIVESEDTARTGRSVWGRREVFINATGEGSTAAVTSRGQARLEASRAKLRFGGTLLDSDQARFGVDWDFGDVVSAEYRDRQFDGLIRSVTIEVNDVGAEIISARLEVEEDV